jgi:hypothetical protein
MGWVDEDGNAAEVPTTMPYEETTLIAVWAPKVDVQYDKNGDGTVDETVTVTSGQKFEAPADPTLEGSRFVDWTYVDENGESRLVDSVLVAEDFMFPICYEGLSNAYVTLKLQGYFKSSEKSKYSRELRIDKIVLKAKE